MKRFSDEHHALVFEKGGHTYIFVFGNSTQQINDLLRRFGFLAVDTDLNFSMSDAAELASRVRKEIGNGQSI